MYLIDMDQISGNVIPSRDLTVRTHGHPVLVPGKLRSAIRLDGSGQYVDAGDHRKACLGNVELCRHGLTQSMWIQFREFRDNMYYVSNGRGVRVFHKDGNLHVVIAAARKQWEVAVPDLQKDTWHFVEYTWHPEKGLQVFVNNRLVGSRETPVTVQQRPPPETDSLVLIGNANTVDSEVEQTFSTNGVIDEVETWYRDRDNLIAFDYILRGKLLMFGIHLCLCVYLRFDINFAIHRELHLLQGAVAVCYTSSSSSSPASPSFISLIQDELCIQFTARQQDKVRAKSIQGFTESSKFLIDGFGLARQVHLSWNRSMAIFIRSVSYDSSSFYVLEWPCLELLVLENDDRNLAGVESAKRTGSRSQVA